MIAKDSDQVINFMRLFHQLREWADDEPEALWTLARTDESLAALCKELFLEAFFIPYDDRRQPRLFSFPVDPEFIRAWRDYEQRYESVVSAAYFDFDSDFGARSTTGRMDADWSIADRQAQGDAKAIQGAISYALDQVSDADRHFDDDFEDHIVSGAQALEQLETAMGFDLQAVFRRRALVPFVLVPRQVAQHHGENEPISLLTHLHQAQSAFVFGTPFAAVALMRSVLEATLRLHYTADEGDLGQLINSARNLPAGASAPGLHRLRRLANDVLHLNKDRVRLPADLEKELLLMFHILRTLIENAPRAGRR